MFLSTSDCLLESSLRNYSMIRHYKRYERNIAEAIRKTWTVININILKE